MHRWGAHFTCIAPDTPGFGQSEALPGTPEIGDFAEALGAFLDALGVRRCAAYGFHSGGIILMALLKRQPARFSAVAIGGYAIWTADEMRLFGERYLPEFHPSPYGEHLTWLWNRMLEQSWFFPWFDVRDAARLSVAHADVGRVHQAAMEMLDAGHAYRAAYGAVLRAPRDIPDPDAPSPPTLVTAYDGDPLQAHIARLGPLPPHWQAYAVATPQQHEDESFEFLAARASDAPCPPLAENDDAGWVAVGNTLIHWRGARGADRLILHAPATEMADPAPGTLAIDVPGHGLSSADADWRAAIGGAARALGAQAIAWPAPPPGDPALLYPDLSPDRFGGHLLRAWSAARAEVLFAPWYAADKDHAITFDPAAIEPAAIARRARARLRSGAAAAAWHAALSQIQQDPRP